MQYMKGLNTIFTSIAESILARLETVAGAVVPSLFAQVPSLRKELKMPCEVRIMYCAG